MAIRFRAGMPTLIDGAPVPQRSVKTTAQLKKVTGQSTDPMAKTVSSQQTIVEHNRKIYAARQAAQAKRIAAAKALEAAEAAEEAAEAEESAEEATVTSASASSKTEIIEPLPDTPPLVASQPPKAVPQRPVSQGPASNRVPGRPQPIGRTNR